MTVALHLDQVVGRYGGLTALGPLTLDIAQGSRHAVIGPNGAGKSTLLKLIAGTLRPASGRVCFAGRDITGHREAARARAGIGRTFQHPGVVGALSVAENLRLARHRARTGGTVVEGLLDRIGLTGLAGTLAGQLPYGQQRILELGMVLAARPRLLLLDEPSVGLDPEDITRLTTLLTGLPPEVSVVLVEHHLDLVYRVADTITVLDQGELAATGPADKIRTDPRAHHAYLTPTEPGVRRGTPEQRPGQAPAPVVLAVDDLRAGYRGADVLRHICLEAVQGEIHAVLGRNGAGKTTLLNTIAGLHPARSGRITLDGRQQRRRRRGGSGRDGIAVVAQGRRLYASLTGAEHLALAARLHQAPPGLVDEILDLMPSLRPHLGRACTLLSGGQQQMLALAQALLARPRLLLLDEPTDGLGPAVTAHLAQMLSTLAGQGMSILLAEQNLGFALPLADRITVLEHGTTAYCAEPGGPDDPAVTAQLAALLGISSGAAS